MNKWIMLLCAGLLVVMIGCGPKDPAAETGAGTDVSKPEDTTKPTEEATTAPTEENKTEDATAAPTDESKPSEPAAPGAETKPEEGKGGPKTPEKPAGEPATK